MARLTHEHLPQTIVIKAHFPAGLYIISQETAQRNLMAMHSKVLTIKVGSVKLVVRLWNEGRLRLQQSFPLQLGKQGHGLHLCRNSTKHILTSVD